MVKLKIHTKSILYFTGLDMVKAREQLGLTQEEFAFKCGWKQQNQQQLEAPGIRHYLDSNKRERFKRAGLEIINS